MASTLATAAQTAATQTAAAATAQPTIFDYVFVLRDAKPEDGVPRQLTVEKCPDADSASWLLLRWLTNHCGVAVATLADPQLEVYMTHLGAGATAGPTPRTRLTDLFSRYTIAFVRPSA